MSFTWIDPLELITRPTTTQPDLDGDGIPDSIDLCDFSPERFNGFQDEDGCPDLDPIGFDPTTILDADGDGILDADDLCPTQPEIFNGIDDGDGCPEGAILAQNFASFEVTGQELVDLSLETSPLEPLPTTEELIEPTIIEPIPISEPIPAEDISLVEEIPLTPFQGIQDPVGNSGQTNFCNNLTDDCNQIFTQAVRNFEQTGIMLPFQPSILNIIIIIGIIVGVILIVLRLRRKI